MPKQVKAHSTNLGMLATALLACTTAGCVNQPSVWIERTQSMQMDAAGVRALQVDTHNGYIKVLPAADGEKSIALRATIKAGGRNTADAEACMQAIEIQTPSAGSTQTIKTAWLSPRKNNWARKVSFDITMPADLALRAASHNGKIEIDDLHGNCVLKTHNGDIQATHAGVQFTATSHNGNIDARIQAPTFELLTHNGRINAQLQAATQISGHVVTHNGRVTLDIAEGASAMIKCSTYNGSIWSKLNLSDIESSKRGLQGRLGEGTTSLDVTTHNGSISLK